MPRKQKKRNTSRLSRLLENGIHALRLRGFEVFAGNKSLLKYQKLHGCLPPRYIVRPFTCPSLYGTPGRKEALIHCDESGDFIFEAKYQNKSGSVDEKCPYLRDSFISSPHHWIVWFDGNWFEHSERGRAAVRWLKHEASLLTYLPRRLYVVSGNTEFYNLLDRLFPVQAKPVPGDLITAMEQR